MHELNTLRSALETGLARVEELDETREKIAEFLVNYDADLHYEIYYKRDEFVSSLIELVKNQIKDALVE